MKLLVALPLALLAQTVPLPADEKPSTVLLWAISVLAPLVVFFYWQADKERKAREATTKTFNDQMLADVKADRDEWKTQARAADVELSNNNDLVESLAKAVQGQAEMLGQIIRDMTDIREMYAGLTPEQRAEAADTARRRRRTP